MILVFAEDVVIILNNNMRFRGHRSNRADVYMMMMTLLMVVIKEDYYFVSVFKDATEQTVPEL